MQQLLILLAALAILFAIMMAGLKFGKYKERTSGCCGGGHCTTSKQNDDACRENQDAS